MKTTSRLVPENACSLKRRIILVVGFVVCYVATTFSSLAQGIWVPVTNPAPTACGGVMLLLSDGTILAKSSAGGLSYGNEWNKLTPDIHGSYINGTWTTIDTMFNTRYAFASQVLRDGRVYVAGGEYGSGGTSVELYNTRTGHWVPAPSMTGGDFMSDGPSEILPDGRVLQAYFPGAGGDNGCKIFDPASNIFFPGPSVIGSFDETTWLKLPDNSILFVDHGLGSERYVPALNNWIADDTLPVPLFDSYDFETGPAFLLPDGRAIFFGSPTTTAYYTPSGTASPGVWAAGPYFPGGQGMPDAAGAMMVNGKILVATSMQPYGPMVFPTPTSFYEFDYLSNSFIPISAPGGAISLPIASGSTNMLDLPDGSVLYATTGSTAYFEYVPDGSPLAAGKPTISSVIKLACDTYKITGTLFNGITEGAGFGDDWQMSTNYPLVRLSAGGNVYYAFSYNWNSTSVMRGTAHDTAYFILPAALPEGTYDLEVVTNGNPSAPHTFTTCMPSLSVSQTTLEEHNGLSVYPNPATRQTTVTFESKDAGRYELRLIDVFGRVVMKESAESVAGENNVQVDLSNVPGGLYTVALTAKDRVSNKKIVVE